MIPATISKNVNGNTLKKLVPFRHLSDPMLDQVLHRSRIHQLSKGENCLSIPGTKNHLWFLLKGNITVERADGTVETFTQNDVAANFPLNAKTNPASSISCSHSAIVICTPEQSSQESLAVVDDSISVSEGGVEEQLYLEFYNSLKNSELELPSMPDLAIRIIRMVDNPNTNSEDLAKVIEFDAALSTRIVQVVNSPMYAAHTKITHCRDAITRLGRKTTRTLAISFLLKNLYKTDSKILKKRMIDLWEHSAKVAAISSILAKITPGLSPDEALLSGLLHDIGIIPILNSARQHPELLKQPELLDKAIHELRAEIGIMTMKHWELDGGYHEIPRHAEDWQYDSGNKIDYSDIVILAQLHSFIGTPAMASQNLPEVDQIPAFKKLALGKLSPKLSIAVLDKAQKSIDEVQQLLMS